MAQSLGILGGVFDPVHNGHLSIATFAREFFHLEKVIFIPSGAPPHKNSVTASASDRLAMLERALHGVSEFCIWDGEVYREGYSYTIDTLGCLKEQFPDSKIHFIIGSDNLSEICRWRSYEQIIKQVTLCVAVRPGFSTSEVPSELTSASLELFPSPEWGLSSTILRSYLREGYSCKFLIPDSVLLYINEKGLYGYQSR